MNAAIISQRISATRHLLPPRVKTPATDQISGWVKETGAQASRNNFLKDLCNPPLIATKGENAGNGPDLRLALKRQ
jgi:hypothetical protein